MTHSIYLVNPSTDIAGYFAADMAHQYNVLPITNIADLSIVTVAAFVPKDWHIEICDELLTCVDLETTCEFIGITGKVTQARRMLELCSEFQRRGKTVIVGGPYASMNPEVFRGHCDVLVTGELENIAATLFTDLSSGLWQTEYTGDKADMTLSPLPRWDLYPVDRALSGCVQTSRGCPFECEFCDVIIYLGRKQRYKSPGQVIDELEIMYDMGFHTVFLADDNLTASRKKAHELLTAIAKWNASKQGGGMELQTQLSIDVANDEEMVALCAAAGITWVFIGIETLNQESLKETKKRQNVGVDILDKLQVFLRHGIAVFAGMIVGFDHDGPDCLDQQFTFAMESPIPIFTLGPLVALAGTPLYARLKTEGRLLMRRGVAGHPFETNIVPKQMTTDALVEGVVNLFNDIYRPGNFGQRVVRMVESLQQSPVAFRSNRRAVESDVYRIIAKLSREDRQLMTPILAAVRKKPFAMTHVVTSLFWYSKIKLMQPLLKESVYA